MRGYHVWTRRRKFATNGASIQQDNSILSISVHNEARLVECPRQRPTCLETSGVLDSIGCTPLMRLQAASKTTGCSIFAKAEYLNPGGSIKDRIAKHIILEAERRGELQPGSTIMEVTSGNTGIALAMVGAIRGYKVVIMMPRTVSKERRDMIESLGAELHLLDKINDMQTAVARTIELAAGDTTIFLPSQFSNPDNIECHRLTTGPEISRQVTGDLDAFVMGVGTGGTLMGVGQALRDADKATRIVAVEPDESAVMSGDHPGCHGIQGLADGFIPDLIELQDIDQIVRIKTADAKIAAQALSQQEGLLVGISSGANVLAATQIATELGPGHTVVTVLPDRGERYLSLS